MDTDRVYAARMAALARYGSGSKTPTLRDLEEPRKTATMPATVRHPETASVDDALDPLDVLIGSRLLGLAERVLGAAPDAWPRNARTGPDSMSVLLRVTMSSPAGMACRGR
ncbi:hypothetical protein ACFY2V_17580 [Streptomyces eurythermus]|uniref:hypothetical protein n=1 Tax=Streptomyces eurythermus TaxID=42237 RepID=UPI0036805E64